MDHPIVVRDADASEIEALARVWYDAYRDAHEALLPHEHGEEVAQVGEVGALHGARGLEQHVALVAPFDPVEHDDHVAD